MQGVAENLSAPTDFLLAFPFSPLYSTSHRTSFRKTLDPGNNPDEFDHAHNIGTGDPFSTLNKQAWFDLLRHGKTNVLFWDGHVQGLGKTEAKVYTQKPDGTLLWKGEDK